MNLREYLSLISLDSLIVIAENLKQQSRGKTKAELVNLIDRRLSDPAFLKRVLERLTPRELETYNLLAFSGKGGLYSGASTAVGGKRAKAVHNLTGKGLVIVKSSFYRGLRYTIPNDLRVLSLQILARPIMSQVKTCSAQGLQLRECGLAILRDIFTLLSSTAYQEVYLTQKGEIRKRIWRSISQKFEMDDKEADESYYPSRREFILSYCRMKRLIRLNDRMMPNSGQLHRWLEMSNFERLEDLLSFSHHYMSSQYDLKEGISALLKSADSSELFDLNSFIEVSFSRCYAINKERRSFLHYTDILTRFLRILFWLGILRFGIADTGDIVALGVSELGADFFEENRESPAFAVSEELFVQPNFELLVPRNIDFKLRFRLEEFADSLKIDQMIVYKVSKESVYRALDKGMSKKDIISFLHRYSKNKVPQNVEYSIEEWARNYGRIFFQDVFLLRTEDKSLADEIKANPRLKKFIKGEICPTALVVEREEYSLLLKALNKAGYMPRKFESEEGEEEGLSPLQELPEESDQSFWAKIEERISPEEILEPVNLLKSNQTEGQANQANVKRRGKSSKKVN